MSPLTPRGGGPAFNSGCIISKIRNLVKSLYFIQCILVFVNCTCHHISIMLPCYIDFLVDLQNSHLIFQSECFIPTEGIKIHNTQCNSLYSHSDKSDPTRIKL